MNSPSKKGKYFVIIFTIGIVKPNININKQNQLFNPKCESTGIDNTFIVKCTGKTANELTLYHMTIFLKKDILSKMRVANFARTKDITVPNIAQTTINGKSSYLFIYI